MYFSEVFSGVGYPPVDAFPATGSDGPVRKDQSGPQVVEGVVDTCLQYELGWLVWFWSKRNVRCLPSHWQGL